MWHIYTVEYYSALKRNKIGSFVETWKDLDRKSTRLNSSHFLVAHFVRHRDPARLSFLSAETSDFLFKDNQLGSKVECAAIYNSQVMEAT